MRQRRVVGAVLAGVVATSGAGWAAGAQMRSPAQVAADTAPPDPSLITAPVERRTLESTVTTRGTVRYGEPRSVVLAASSLGGSAGGSSLVTRPAEPGATLGESDVALEVSGRPVRVLQGIVPMYRDLRPGDTGDDVRQLEEALARLGFRPGPVDGTYDVATEGAVDAWYEAAGYQAQGPSDEQREALRAARAGVSAAEDQELAARDALDKARNGVTARDVAQAEADERAAVRELAKAREDADAAKADETSAGAAAAAARAEEEAAKVRAADQRARADAAVADAERAATSAGAADQAAADRLLRARTEIDPATGQRRATDADVAALQAEADRAAAGAAAARAELAAARTARDDAYRAAAAGVAEAAGASRQAAEAAARAARAVPDAARAVAAADDRLALARTALDVVRRPPDTATAAAQLAKAGRDVAEARRQLAELDGEVGVVVPAGEVLFFPTLPLRVDEAKAARGDDAGKEVMVVSTSRLAVDASVSVPDARLVEVGDKVSIRSEELGVDATGVVSELADRPGTDGVDAQKVYMEVVPDNPPAELTGASVRLSIAVRSTGGEVLAVPVAALSMGSDGRSRVQVAGAGGSVRTVNVEAGLAAGGYVEVKGGGLTEGDRVVVGSAGTGA